MDFASGIVTACTRTGYLVCTGTNQYVLVCTSMYQHIQIVQVYTSLYLFVPDQRHVCWKHIGALIHCCSTNTYMSSTQSIVSDSHMPQKSFLSNILVSMVHSSSTGSYSVHTSILNNMYSIGEQHVLPSSMYLFP
jgi:hypothetical protein